MTVSSADSPLDGKIYLTDSALDRCSVPHCICKVKPAPALVSTAGSRSYSRLLSVYFANDSHTLAQSQQERLLSWIDKAPSDLRLISIFSYTDGLGTTQYNLQLAGNRNRTVQSALSSVTRRFIVRTSVVGEIASGYDPYSRRADVVIHTAKSLTTKIDKVRADVYLLDASGSMWDRYNNWVDVISASFRPGSRIYLSIMRGCTNGQRIDRVTPQSGTEIWYSYWKVLDDMSPNETLAIVSDFQSNYPLSVHERSLLAMKVREKNIRVVVIRP